MGHELTKAVDFLLGHVGTIFLQKSPRTNTICLCRGRLHTRGHLTFQVLILQWQIFYSFCFLLSVNAEEHMVTTESRPTPGGEYRSIHNINDLKFFAHPPNEW